MDDNRYMGLFASPDPDQPPDEIGIFIGDRKLGTITSIAAVEAVVIHRQAGEPDLERWLPSATPPYHWPRDVPPPDEDTGPLAALRATHLPRFDTVGNERCADCQYPWPCPVYIAVRAYDRLRAKCAEG